MSETVGHMQALESERKNHEHFLGRVSLKIVRIMWIGLTMLYLAKPAPGQGQ